MASLGLSSLNARLLRLMSSDEESSMHLMYEKKINSLSFSVDEHETIHQALTSDTPMLRELVSASIWQESRTMLYVLLEASPYLTTISNHPFHADGSSSKGIRDLYLEVVRSNEIRSSKQVLPRSTYQRISSVLNATYLTKFLELTADGIITNLDYTEMVLVPLIKNEGTILKSLPAILDINESLTKSWRETGDECAWMVESLIDIANLLGENPEAADYIMASILARGAYDGELVREGLRTGAVALVAGTL